MLTAAGSFAQGPPPPPPGLYHKYKGGTPGVREQECAEMLRAFFRERRAET